MKIIDKERYNLQNKLFFNPYNGEKIVNIEKDIIKITAAKMDASQITVGRDYFRRHK